LPAAAHRSKLGTVPDRKLRSNFTPGTTPWAMRRAQWTALGLTDADLEKPKIAIVNSSSQLASCFSHLDEIVAPLKAAIAQAGEVAVEGALLDGMVCLASRGLYARTVGPLGQGATLGGMPPGNG
jgi:dihydroxy-acid dehydratase